MTVSRIISGIKQRFYKWLYRRRINNTYVLMLHEVTNGERAKYPDISIEKDNFEAMLKKFQEKGYMFDEIKNIFEPSNNLRVIVTFDDIFENAFTNALPILDRHNIPFVVFITSEYIDCEGYITAEQLKELINNPLCTIGFHATKHVMMRDYTKEEIAKIVDDVSFMEKYGVKSDYFAYPYGSMYACPNRAIKVVSKLNYKGAFGTIDSPVNEKTIKENPYYIPRVCVSNKSVDNIIKGL